LYGGKQEQIQEPVKDTRLSDIYTNVQLEMKHENNYSLYDDVTRGIFSILAPETGESPERGNAAAT
jgi:hypothetical protein